MTTDRLDRRITGPNLHDLTPGDDRFTAGQIARRAGVPVDVAWEAIRIAVRVGYLDRDEFGTYAAWCRWPRCGV